MLAYPERPDRAQAHGGLALLRRCPSIVFGVDVNHPQPGSNKPSFAAICATMDQECAEYFTSVKAVGSRTEISQDGFQEEIRKAIVEALTLLCWKAREPRTRVREIHATRLAFFHPRPHL